MALRTLVVVILILLSTTGELTLSTHCAQADRTRRQLYESNGEKECGEEDEDVGRDI